MLEEQLLRWACSSALDDECIFVACHNLAAMSEVKNSGMGSTSSNGDWCAKLDFRIFGLRKVTKFART